MAKWVTAPIEEALGMATCSKCPNPIAVKQSLLQECTHCLDLFCLNCQIAHTKELLHHVQIKRELTQ